MEETKGNINFTNEELLEKFLSGDLTALERFELEKRALDDPFLFEALEAYSKYPFDKAGEFTSIEKRIEHRISQDQRVKHIFPLRSISGIAATLLIIITTLFILDLYIWNKETGNFAEQTAVEIEHSNRIIESKTKSEGSNESIQRNEKEFSQDLSLDVELYPNKSPRMFDHVEVESTTEYQKTKANGQEFRAIESEENSSAFSEKKNENMAEKDDREDELSGLSKHQVESAKRAPAAQADNMEKIEDESVRAGNSYVEGNVRDSYGKPVVGAEVNATKSEKTAKTDSSGNFNMDVSHPEDEIEIVSEGYNDAHAKINGVTKMDVTLNEGAVLSGVNIIASNTFNKASPKMGFEAFEEFILEDLIKPKEAIESGVSGTVTIEFTVGPYGKLSDFRILHSLGYGCDEEAIRLLKGSGDWETFPKFKKMRTVYNFNF